MGGLFFGGGYFAQYSFGGDVPQTVVGPGDEITAANALFCRTVTAQDGLFDRESTAGDATFGRSVTTADAER